jgi:NADH dehydrogenase [ubiquinone] 1 alpha subcomplex assembly factor 7
VLAIFSALTYNCSMTLVTPLNSLLESLIAIEGPITLERYMGLVLHHPDYGYYRQGNPLGAAGDFITSPDISPIFGEMLGVWCFDAWQRLGNPSPFILLELGPGSGALLAAALRLTRNALGFQNAMQLQLLESSITLRTIQQDNLRSYNPIYINDLCELSELPVIVVANEFFDTMPIRQFTRVLGGWRERLVTLKDGALEFTMGRRARLPFAFSFSSSAFAKKMKLGSIYEFSPQAQRIIENIATHIARFSGAGLIVDYGYQLPPMSSTLDALKRHKFVDVFHAPGLVDVTAHVDFSMLASVARNYGITVSNIMTQRFFLEKMGVVTRIKQWEEDLDKDTYVSFIRSVRYLTEKSGMGALKVLEIIRV